MRSIKEAAKETGYNKNDPYAMPMSTIILSVIVLIAIKGLPKWVCIAIAICVGLLLALTLQIETLLLKRKYKYNCILNDGSQVVNEKKEWLRENIDKGSYIFSQYSPTENDWQKSDKILKLDRCVHFRNESDAVLFKVTWAGLTDNDNSV